MPFKPLAALASTRAMFLLDLATIALAWPLALVASGLAAPLPTADGAAALLYPAANLVCLYALGLYRRDVIIETRRSLGRIPLVVGLGTLAGAGASAAVALLLGPAHDRVPVFTAAVVCFLGTGIAARLAFSLLRHRGLFRRRLLVVGAGKRAWDLVWMLRKEGCNLNYDITFVHEPILGDIDPRLADESAGRIVPAATEDVLGVARSFGADQIVVAPDERRGMALESLLECKVAGFPVKQYLSFVEKEIRRVDLKRMELGWLLYSDGFYFGVIDRVLKRVLDLAVSATLLLVFGPWLLLAMAAVKLDDGGPVFYSQERVTKAGRSFRIRKLRTMRVDAEAGGAVWAASKDDRITRVGVFLRRTRLDELPQLFNVLRGDMSLVGPRPERPAFVRMLAEQIPLYHERHVVKAGLTGWAQVNYPYGASTDDARSKLSYDLYYVKNFSVLFDLLIILQTIRVVLWPGGVR